jgi:hypothetical protein
MKCDIECSMNEYREVKLLWKNNTIFAQPLTLDEIEDLELQLTEVILELQKYRMENEKC